MTRKVKFGPRTRFCLLHFDLDFGTEKRGCCFFNRDKPKVKKSLEPE